MKTCDECYLVDTDACPQGGRANDNRMCKDILKSILPVPCKIDASLISVKPISFAAEEKMNTNLRMLKDLDAEQLYDKMVWLFQDYGKRFTDSRASIIEWLNSEVEKDEKTNN